MKLHAISDLDNVVTANRNKKAKKIHFNDVRVGDILKIKAGMNIPVDGIVIKGSGITTNESAMTGEPEEL